MTKAPGDGSAILLERPADARALLLLAHGAGAGMRHPFTQALAEALARAGIATCRYEFPYMAAGRKAPDRAPVLIRAVRDAVAAARAEAPDLPLFAGGKSMGGRMSSLAQAETPLADVQGLVFFGFPLHPAGRPGTARADHLDRIDIPMLFLQGERDRLAEPGLLAPVVERLGDSATLHVVPFADHGFHVPKRVSGRTDGEVIEDLASRAAAWMDQRGSG